MNTFKQDEEGRYVIPPDLIGIRNSIEPDKPGLGDDIPCEKCGKIALDTGLECSECGHDNYLVIMGKPFSDGAKY